MAIKFANGIGFAFWKYKTMFKQPEHCEWKTYTICNIILLFFHIKFTINSKK